MIKVKNLKKQFGNNVVLKDISVAIEKGEVVSVIGPSGSGKSTFLRCINGLEEFDGGHIFVDNEDMADKNLNIDKLREKIGMVFQSFNLFPHLTVLENIILAPVTLKKMHKEEAKIKAKELLKGNKLKLSAICNMVGFEDYNYFSRAFKRHYGISPKKYEINLDKR